MCKADSFEPISLDINQSDHPEYRIETPNYPFYYPTNQTCVWIVSVPEGQKVRIEFEELQLISDKDALFIGEGDDPANRSTVFLHRGRIVDNHVIFSNVSRIWIQWVPDSESYLFHVLSIWKSFEIWAYQNVDDDAKRMDVSLPDDLVNLPGNGPYFEKDSPVWGNDSLNYGFRLKLSAVLEGNLTIQKEPRYKNYYTSTIFESCKHKI